MQASLCSGQMYFAEFRHRGQHLVVEILASGVSFGADGLEADGVELGQIVQHAVGRVGQFVKHEPNRGHDRPRAASRPCASARCDRSTARRRCPTQRARHAPRRPRFSAGISSNWHFSDELPTLATSNLHGSTSSPECSSISRTCRARERDIDDAFFDRGTAGMIGDDAVDAQEARAGKLAGAHEHHPLARDVAGLEIGPDQHVRSSRDFGRAFHFLRRHDRATAPHRVGIRRRCRGRDVVCLTISNAAHHAIDFLVLCAAEGGERQHRHARRIGQERLSPCRPRGWRFRQVLPTSAAAAPCRRRRRKQDRRRAAYA